MARGETMPEYLAPGVYVEEVSFRSNSIEGVPTSTAGFVGSTRFGPVAVRPCFVTSLREFERIYGDGGQLDFSDAGTMHNYVWHAARAFFAQGGRRLYVARAFHQRSDDDGIARCNLSAAGGATALEIRARYPGAAGNFRVRLTFHTGANGPGGTVGTATVGGLRENVRVAVTILLNDGSTHQCMGSADSLLTGFPGASGGQGFAHTLPVVITPGSSLSNGLDVLNALFASKPTLSAALDNPRSTDADRSIDLLLAGGNDGARPTADEYAGSHDLASGDTTGLRAFEDIEDISIVAAPGSTFGYRSGYEGDATTILGHLISHAERMRYRIAVLDSGDGLGIPEVRAMRARYDSKSAAFYYPWVRVLDPITSQEIGLPPSGFVCGIYARNDIQRGVHKAPANEVVNLAVGLEIVLNDAQHDDLNPEGIDCFRFFEGRGILLWGARTISSDAESKYVNVRRCLAYLERSIERGTQWTVFEPNGDALWANVRRSVEDFLLNEWQSGALLGDKPETAFYVRCDSTTMTQNDLDNGRMICVIGVAPLRPAEFVIVRVGQWTADRRCPN
jgi:uncharacterized protein